MSVLYCIFCNVNVCNLLPINPISHGGGHICPPFTKSHLSQNFWAENFFETPCKFLKYYVEEVYQVFGAKKISKFTKQNLRKLEL